MNKKLFLLGIAGILFSLNLATANDETVDTGSTTTTQTGTNTQETTTNVEQKQDILLQAKITQAYKVSLKWNKISSVEGEEIANYVILVSTGEGNLSYPATEGVKSIAVDPDKDSAENWNAIQGGNTYYKVCAVTQSEKAICSNEVKIVMGPNGGPAYGSNQYQSGNRQYMPKPFSGDCLGTGEHRCMPSMSGEFASGFAEKWKMGRPMMSGQNFSGNTDRQWGTGDFKKAQQAQRKSFLSQKTKQYLESKLNAVPDEKKLELFKRIIEKIQNKIEKTKQNTEMKEAKRYALIGALKEIKEIIMNKINNMENNSVDETTIDSLFDDSGE